MAGRYLELSYRMYSRITQFGRMSQVCCVQCWSTFEFAAATCNVATANCCTSDHVTDCADFDGLEGVFYRCHATDELNERIGDVEERVLTLEVGGYRKTNGLAVVQAVSMNACPLQVMVKVFYTDTTGVLQAQLSRVALLELQSELQAVLTPNLRWLAELDVTCAMAEVSSEKCFVRPTLTSSNVLKIIKGGFVHS